jgi:hypothetical protein
MRLPDLEESLITAGLVLGVKRERVEGLVPVERLHQALLGPTASVDGRPLLQTPAEIIKRLVVDVAHGRILPTSEDDFRLGWLLAQRAIELSNATWRPPRGHQARLDEFGAQLRDGVDPGRPFVQWLREGIRLPHEPAEREDPSPILVSSPMHPAPDVDIAAWAYAVDSGASRAFEHHGEGEGSFTHRPQMYPIVAESAGALLRSIEEKVHTSDGLVVLAPHCSWGAAMELEAGLLAMIPILFLHPEDAAPSKGARAHLEEMGATIYALHSDPKRKEAVAEVKSLVYQWLEKAAPLIIEARRRRACIEQRYAPFLGAIREKRTQMTALEEKDALAVAGIRPDRARTLIEEPWGLQSAGFAEFVSLANAYGARANLDRIVQEPISDRPPYLTPAEQDALRTFCKKKSLSTEEAVDLAAAGQRQVAMPLPGRHRLLLTDPTKWNDIWDLLQGED